MFGLPYFRGWVVVHADRAVDVLSRADPLKVATSIIPLVAVDVVNLRLVRSTACNKSLCHKNVNTYV